MPAVSKAQKKLFQLALAVKKGLVDKNKVDDKIKDLSKKPEKDLKDYAETPDKKLPNKLEENAPMATPASVNGMGDVSLPGNPTTQDAFSTQETGSGDLAATSALTDGSKKEKKKAKDMYKFLKYNAFVGESLNEATGLSLDKIMKDDPDGKDGFLEIAKLLGAKPSDIVVYDADEDGDSKEYKKLDREFTKGNSFKDAKTPEYEDYYGANVAYSKKLNVASTYSSGYLSFFALKESVDEGVSNFDDAYWHIDKWLNFEGFPDENELYDEWEELTQKGNAKDILDFIQSYADEDQLYRYGIVSRDMKKFAKYIADSQRS